MGQLRGGDHVLVGGVGPPIADVVHHRVAEQEGILQHDPDLAAQAVGRHVAHVVAVDQHRAAVHVVEARQQVDDGRLARAGRPDDGDGLARLGGQAHAAQHVLVLVVAHPHVAQLDAPLDGRHLDRAGLVDHVRHFVQKLEDALDPGDGALHVGPQRRDHLDRLVELLGVGEERHDQAERDHGPEQVLLAQHQDTAHAGHDHDRDVAQRFERRGQRAGEGHRLDVGVAVGGVGLAEALDVLVLAGEGLRLAHPGDVLLQVGVHPADLAPGLAECLARLVREPDRRQRHDGHRRHADQGERHAAVEHGVRQPHDQQHAAHHLHQREADHLLDRLDVVGQAAHDVARFVFGVIAQRQAVDVAEDLDA